MTLFCRYCKKECKNANSLRNHERLCKKNEARQEMDWLKNRNAAAVYPSTVL